MRGRLRLQERFDGSPEALGGLLDLVEALPQGVALLGLGGTFEAAACPTQGLGREVRGRTLELVGKFSNNLRLAAVDGPTYLGEVLVQRWAVWSSSCRAISRSSSMRRQSRSNRSGGSEGSRSANSSGG